MRVVAIVQARVQSTRLPGKVLLPLRQRPVINHILDRLANCDKVTDIILAIPEDEENTVLRKLSLSSNVDCVSGSHDDVTSRFAKAAEVSEADVIVRVTGDSPLISPYLVDVTVEALIGGEADYAVMRGTALGTEAEVVTKDAFDRIGELAVTPDLKEHPTLAVYKFPERFKVLFLDSPAPYARPEYRLTLDTKEDYLLIKTIYEKVPPSQGHIRVPDVFAFLDANPGIAAANSGVEQRLEGFLTERKEAISNARHQDRTPPD